MSTTHKIRKASLVLLLVGTLATVTGCDGLGMVNLNIYIPLGLDGNVGLFNPTGQGGFVLPPGNGDIEPPTPVQIGDQTVDDPATP